MLLGHYGLALGAKRVAPRLSLGWLVLAAESADLLWPMLLLTGIESVQINDNRNALLRLTFVRYPITHSLVVEVLFDAALAAVFWWRTRDVAAAVTCGLLVPSHWLLDAIVHIPDLPVWPGGPKSRSLALGSAHNWIRADGFPDRHSHLLEDYPRQEQDRQYLALDIPCGAGIWLCELVLRSAANRYSITGLVGAPSVAVCTVGVLD
jgi:hypothetical protein